MVISVHPIQAKIWRALKSKKLKTGMSLRQIVGVIDEKSPQKIKHHLEVMRKRGSINWKDGMYKFNCGYEMTHILIVGNGSIGKRHARNLKSLGCDISVVDPREDRQRELDSEMDIKGHFTSLKSALSASNFDGAFICYPFSNQTYLFLFFPNRFPIICPSRIITITDFIWLPM